MLTNIAFTQEQILYIKQILVKNQGTIEAQTKIISESKIEGSSDLPLKVSSDEIATCIRILETEYQYVSGK